MKCAIYHGPHELTMEDRPEPEVGSHDALLEITYAGVCGSDVTAWTYDGAAVGIVEGKEFGHEFSGIIAAVGEDVVGIKVGDRVWVNPGDLQTSGQGLPAAPVVDSRRRSSLRMQSWSTTSISFLTMST